MSNTWKAVNKSSASSNNGQRLPKSNHKKYTPLLSDSESNLANRFKNQTLSRNQSAFINSQMEDGKSIQLDGKESGFIGKDRVLKGCASELKLKSEVFSSY